MTFRYSIIVATLLLGGCVSIPQWTDSAEQDLGKISVWETEQSQQAVTQTLLTDLIELPELQMLADKALQANPGIKETALALEIAAKQRGVVRASQLPSASLGLDAQRGDTNGTAAYQYTTNLNVSWELDLWGQLADNTEAAVKEMQMEEARYQGARDSLVAEVMRGWLTWVSNQQLLDIEKQRAEVQADNVKVIQNRYCAGTGSLDDLDTARSSLSSTRATIASYEENIKVSKRALANLLGEQAIDLPANVNLPEVALPLADLPEQTLAHRPDLQQAFYNIEAQQLKTSVAYKSLLPTINLTASLQDVGTTPSDALLSSPSWDLLGGLTAPLFQGGALRNSAEISELQLEQAYWAYRTALLDAVMEVENALGQERSTTRQQNHLNDALESAERSQNSYQDRYRDGLADITELLQVQQNTFDIQSQLIQVSHDRLANRINLGLALGLRGQQ